MNKNQIGANRVDCRDSSSQGTMARTSIQPSEPWWAVPILRVYNDPDSDSDFDWITLISQRKKISAWGGGIIHPLFCENETRTVWLLIALAFDMQEVGGLNNIGRVRLCPENG